MSDLYATLQEVRDAVVVAASSLNKTLPDRQFLVMGGAAYDCEQFVVSGMSGTPGIPGTEVPGGVIESCPPGSWLADVEVAIVRKAKSGVMSSGAGSRRGAAVPSGESYEKDAQTMSGDFDLLRLAANSLAGGSEGQYGSITASIVMGQAQGGLVATVLSLSIVMWAPLPSGG